MALAGQGMDQAEIQPCSLGTLRPHRCLLGSPRRSAVGIESTCSPRTNGEKSLMRNGNVLRHLVAEEMTSDKTTSVQLKHLDAEMLRLAEAQRKRSKRTDTGSADDLIIGDIHYRPVIILMFLGVAFLGAAWVSFCNRRWAASPHV